MGETELAARESAGLGIAARIGIRKLTGCSGRALQPHAADEDSYVDADGGAAFTLPRACVRLVTRRLVASDKKRVKYEELRRSTPRSEHMILCG
ncbi:hypothetical protein GUJ93_ZPchr0010g7696 [Zizania palustris]|uniref:Uncharacterized protein n=1 Tax=Zizania palustris TaxID=103762 RepID=A0A8J6BE36_ZIZPA|nr:hypothetical protein GUJ93_ZPchr0010g7696 [Zizania palustris]